MTTPNNTATFSVESCNAAAKNRMQTAAAAIAAIVNQIDPRLTASVEDDCNIVGSFRGKANTGFKYSIYSRRFIYDNTGGYAFGPIDQAQQQVEQDAVSNEPLTEAAKA